MLSRLLDLLNHWQATVIKGNPAEISALAGMNEVSASFQLCGKRSTHVVQVQSRGVDSVGSGFADPARVVKQLALRERELPSTLFLAELSVVFPRLIVGT